MPQFDEKHVKIDGCFVVWDGITRPDQGPEGKVKYSLKVVVDPNSPDLPLLQQIAQNCLNESEFKGQLPQGANWSIGQTRPGEFNDMYPGWVVLNCNSQRLPDVYDENGQRLEPMQYSQLIFGGQRVDVLVHNYSYNKAGNKGIATGLDGFAIVASANAQRQNFGGAGIDTSSAFSGGGGGQPAQQQPPAQQPAQQAQPQQQQAYQPPAQQQQQQPAQQQPGQQPQQAHNFMPPQQ